MENKIIDDILIVYFAGLHSYTGEDAMEMCQSLNRRWKIYPDRVVDWLNQASLPNLLFSTVKYIYARLKE
jgi:hypothetical protein